MPEPADPVADLLRKTPTTPAQRADAWDAFQQATSTDDLTTRLKALSIPDSIKADLWDLKARSTRAPDFTATNEPPSPSLRQQAADATIGFAKGAGRTVQAIGDLPQYVGLPGLTDVTDKLYGLPPGASKASMAPTNTAQRVGGYAETATELAPLAVAGAGAIPRMARAGETFQAVMGAAKNVAVDPNAPGQVALRIQELAERGGSMPMAVRKFLNYVSDPNKPALTYEVARDFASNISRLSADEYGRLTPVIAREVSALRVALNKAVADAAAQAGMKAEYLAAMKEYARAAQLHDLARKVVTGLMRSAPYATGTGIGYALGKKFTEYLWPSSP